MAAKYKDVIDLYDDKGKLLKSNVALEKISPLTNPAVKKIIDDTKRTVAVNIGGMQEALKTGKIGKHQQILGRELNLDLVGQIDAVEKKIKEYVSVEKGDDTEIKRFNGGKLLLVKVPTARIQSAATYDAALTSVAAATTYSVVENFKVDMFDASTVKAAAFGSYPVTMDLAGGACSMIMSIPQNNESLGYALRNIPANQTVMITHRNAMQGAALASTFEQAGEFEMGSAIGPFERAQLLLYAY
ncbi:MAG: methyl-coenzyme M reductase subunit beta, partial [Methanocorpusculum sp.]|nr:methyl-coenzyme M reductase subunit beta [Methanocorpusculum sp.]